MTWTWRSHVTPARRSCRSWIPAPSRTPSGGRLAIHLPGYAAYYANAGETRLYPDSLYVEGLFAFCLRNAGFGRHSSPTRGRFASAEATAAPAGAVQRGARGAETPVCPHISGAGRTGVQVSAKQWDSAAARVGNFITKRPARFEQYLSRMLEVLDK